MPIATLSVSHNFMNINTPSKKALEKEKMGGEEQEVKRQHGASRPVGVVHAMEVSPCPPFTYTKAAVTSNHADTLLIAFLLQSYSTLAITHTKW